MYQMVQDCLAKVATEPIADRASVPEKPPTVRANDCPALPLRWPLASVVPVAGFMQEAGALLTTDLAAVMTGAMAPAMVVPEAASPS